MTRPTAIATISAAILTYEVLLVRLMAIVQWHHFAFMAISVALLGFGLSGALLAVFRDAALRSATVIFTLCATLFSVTAPMAFFVAQRLPFNALEIIWAPSQVLYLGLTYIVLAVPFTAGAACIGVAFLAHRSSVGRVYFWNLMGSGAGALGALALLLHVDPIACLAWIAAAGLAAALIGAIQLNQRALAALPLVAGMAGAALWFGAPESWTTLRISPFKDLPRALMVKDAVLVRSYSGPLAHISVVDSPTVPFRYAPGMSLTAPALPPEQLGVFLDGDFTMAMNRWDGRIDSLAYLNHSTDALAYHLAEAPSVLVLGAGGGREVLQALGYGSKGIDAIEHNPDLVRMLRTDFAQVTGGIFRRPEVALTLAHPRHYLATARQRWDIISFPQAGGGAGQRLQGVNETYLLTVDAFRIAYRHLSDGGWMTITTRLDLPPQAMLKLVATVRAALTAEGFVDAAERLLVIRGLTSVTLAVKRGHVEPRDIAAAKAFAEERAFDMVHYPGMPAQQANRRNRLASPEYFTAIGALLGDSSARFIESYKFDIAPTTDDRPYFDDFFRWSSLPELALLGAAGGSALFDLSEPIVAAALAQAIVLGLLLVALPLTARGYRSKSRAQTWRFGGYFAGLGLAFFFIEIAWIQTFTLFLGQTLYAVSIVLAGFLVFAGVGASATDWVRDRCRRLGVPAIAIVVIGVAVVSLGSLLALPALFQALSNLSEGLRIVVALALIAPLAFLMGLPFPLGLSVVEQTDKDFIPWAWGVNGCASVSSAVAAPLLTMNIGFSATVVIALMLYTISAFVLPQDPRCDERRAGAPV